MSYIITCSTKIITWASPPFLFISVGVLCKFAIVPGVYAVALSSQEEVMHYFFRGQIKTFDSTFIKKIWTFLCDYITLPRLLLNWEKHKRNAIVL